ncbi:recombination-associated protein RdgC [Psychrosphaera sp. 1_MG-2023]|uniref:recombination-associated protein RdgC n=1 Tax=Psychrosphaera sp. 1_MG-2023 TaxID=3062643 RepID=UPI0026E32B2C|nr:recombination-associated protein RdgC [Psychrosphaera sp. 1_MG-2023]MDO6718842.1 recombination-associated protein RdgC [Psychrosphaera sp. 1_MG-2023]
MWFTNAISYQFTKPFNVTVEQIQADLEQRPFVPCGSMDSSKQGWASAIPGTTSLVHVVGGNALICLKTEEKILPSSVVNKELNEKVSLLQDDRGQKIGRSERMTLKEEIIQQLLPKAFTKESLLFAYIDYKGQRIVVNASSANKAETLLAFLRQSLGSLPVLPFKPEIDLLATLTDWVKNNSTPAPFTLANNISLKALDEEASQAKLKNLDLTEEEVQLHISNGKYVERLSLCWDNKVLFDLTDEGHFKQVKFLDVIKEQNDDINTDDAVGKFDADFALMAGELNQLLNNLAVEYGSEA